jgi:hypothetical protein
MKIGFIGAGNVTRTFGRHLINGLCARICKTPRFYWVSVIRAGGAEQSLTALKGSRHQCLWAFDGTPSLMTVGGYLPLFAFPCGGRSALLAAPDFLNARTLPYTTLCSKSGLCGSRRTLNLS